MSQTLVSDRIATLLQQQGAELIVGFPEILPPDPTGLPIANAAAPRPAISPVAMDST